MKGAINVVNIETRIPPAVIAIGNQIDPGLFTSSAEVAETTSAAQVASAREPNKSDPIPAISPTLSPTLSAMTPGL